MSHGAVLGSSEALQLQLSVAGKAQLRKLAQEERRYEIDAPEFAVLETEGEGG
jgi:hypothetical protein